jgi:hypothetical protein
MQVDHEAEKKEIKAFDAGADVHNFIQPGLDFIPISNQSDKADNTGYSYQLVEFTVAKEAGVLVDVGRGQEIVKREDRNYVHEKPCLQIPQSDQFPVCNLFQSLFVFERAEECQN